jgi:hypothetical protein
MINIIDMSTHFLQNLSNNKYFIGLAMIFLNLGSRYVEVNLSSGQEMFIKSIAREVLIFTMAFIGTRDIVASLILTGSFIILANFVFNEESNFCMLPEKYKNIEKSLDLNGDNQISQEEINKAVKILEQAKKQEDINAHLSMINSMENNVYQ